MCLETTPGLATPGARQQQPALSKTIESSISRCESSTSASGPRAEHDASLLMAALEHLEAQRAAIEGMVDADLLSLLLV